MHLLCTRFEEVAVERKIFTSSKRRKIKGKDRLALQVQEAATSFPNFTQFFLTPFSRFILHP
jgi:uncharacterized heparinase superfamily protein